MDVIVALNQSGIYQYKNSPKVYRVTLHLIRVHFHVILHGIHVSESAPCFSCTFTLVAEILKWVNLGT